MRLKLDFEKEKAVRKEIAAQEKAYRKRLRKAELRVKRPLTQLQERRLERPN